MHTEGLLFCNLLLSFPFCAVIGPWFFIIAPFWFFCLTNQSNFVEMRNAARWPKRAVFVFIVF